MAENSKEFLLNFKNKLEIDTSGSTDLDKIASAKFAPLAAGITTITPAAGGHYRCIPLLRWRRIH